MSYPNFSTTLNHVRLSFREKRAVEESTGQVMLCFSEPSPRSVVVTMAPLSGQFEKLSVQKNISLQARLTFEISKIIHSQ